MAVDDLRTKIAAATVGHADYVSGLTRYCTCGQWSGDSTGTRIDFSRHLADAVIEALDLGIPCASDGCRMRQIARRSAEKLGLTGDGE